MSESGVERFCYEHAAEHRTNLSGWVCRKCHRYWGDSEHMARWCCGNRDMPCETAGCGGRADRPYTTCRACHSRLEVERFEKLPKVDWDGETPVATWHDDRFFFDADSLSDYVADQLEAGVSPEDVRLVLCDPDNGCDFDMTEFLQDHLPDVDHGGGDLKADGINAAVNAWIAEHAPFSWRPTGKAISVGSIRGLIPPEDQ